jgi:hypothetical protein
MLFGASLCVTYIFMLYKVRINNFGDNCLPEQVREPNLKISYDVVCYVAGLGK